MKIAVLIGSVRPGSNTAKAAHTFAEGLKAAGGAPVAEPALVDPRTLGLTVPGLEEGADAESVVAADLRRLVASCHGVALVTPEYDGSYSAVTKILIESLGYPSALQGKPLTVIGVASGRIGAVRAVEHLRGLMFNVGALVLPTSPTVPSVHKCFAVDGTCLDQTVAAELNGAAAELLRFARRLGRAY